MLSCSSGLFNVHTDLLESKQELQTWRQMGWEEALLLVSCSGQPSSIICCVDYCLLKSTYIMILQEGQDKSLFSSEMHLNAIWIHQAGHLAQKLPVSFASCCSTVYTAAKWATPLQAVWSVVISHARNIFVWVEPDWTKIWPQVLGLI